MSRTITNYDILNGLGNTILKNVGLSDKEIYGTDFTNSWINK